MASDFRVRGSADLAALGLRLRTQDKSLRRDLSREIRSAAKPATDRATRALAAAAPGGALEDRIRRERSSVRVLTGPRSAGVRVGAGKKGSATRQLEYHGRVRHLVFGRPGSWVYQQVPGAKGKWTQRLRAERPTLQRAVIRAMDTTARRITGG